MKLSKIERLILSNQFRILEALYPDDTEYFKSKEKALNEGFELHYDDLSEELSNDVLSEDDCREVLDILDMYRALTFSYESLEDKSGIDPYYLKFRGFDLNDEYECKRLSYVNYFINDLHRFEELKYGQKYTDFNSHSEMMEIYKKMLTRWESLDKNYNLSKQKIIEILEAAKGKI